MDVIVYAILRRICSSGTNSERILRQYLALSDIDPNRLNDISNKHIEELDYTEQTITDDEYKSGLSDILPKLALLGIFSPITV